MPLATRAPHPTDLLAILAINAASAPHVATLDLSELERLIELASLSLVAEHSERLVGYLLAMHRDDAYEGEEFLYFRAHLPDSFLYVDQIAVFASSRLSGVGTSLYAATASWGRDRGIARLCCEVNLRPDNPGSLHFHRSLGFREIGRLETMDGRLVALLSKEV